MYGFEEVVEKEVEVAVVERLDGIVIFPVGLALGECSVYVCAVVVLLGKVDNLGTHENVGHLYRFAQAYPLKRRAAAEGHIGLSAGEDASREVDVHLTEGQSLALVHGYCPCQAYGELYIYTQLLLFYLLFLFVECVSDVLPDFTFNVVFVAVFRHHTDYSLLLVDAADDPEGAVYPPLVLVVLDEYHLCTGLYLQLHRGGERRFGEVALYLAVEYGWLAAEFVELPAVDEVHGVASRCQRYGEVAVSGVHIGTEP